MPGAVGAAGEEVCLRAFALLPSAMRISHAVGSILSPLPADPPAAITRAPWEDAVRERMLVAGYRGRFAPSPTGPLHFGSLVAAVGSYLDARSQGGEWLVRIEDVDAPRCQPGMGDTILRSLDAFGFTWDREVLWQSRRGEAYAAALEQLKQRGLAYACACSRKEIADSATRPAVDGGLAYPGTCRHGLAPGRSARAWRLRVPDERIATVDRIQGELGQHLAEDVGDFVLLRADGLFAYQLAVTVDDQFQQISDIVRGADLLDSTDRKSVV